MASKEKKPDVPIDSIKQVVKKLKNQGFDKLSHFDLALALVTIGFKEVSQQFGAKWTSEHQKQALKILSKSQYDVSWFGKVNNLRYAQLLPLTLRGDIQKIKDLIRTTSKQYKQDLITIVDNFKRTALHLAVKQDFDVLAQFLINEGFSLNARDRQLKTPLHYCRSELVCQLLIKKGANVFVKDNKMCTPVHYAATLDDAKVIEMMLKKSNSVNQVDAQMKTALFYAVFNNSSEQVNIIRVLIENGAKVNQKDCEGRTPLHYASQSGKSRCIPLLLQKGASIQIRDNRNQTPLDLACNQKIKKILLAYSQTKGLILQPQQQQKRQQYKKIQTANQKSLSSTTKQKQNLPQKTNTQIYTKELNQVSTWIREKFFVLMKKLQESGVKANWHMKRPYIYTGSWAEDIDSLEDLYETFLNVSGPEAAMRAFNILCPYEKPLPKVLGKAQEAFQSFFGQNWFSNDPIEKQRHVRSHTKVRTQLQVKAKQAQDLRTQLLGYRTQMQSLQGQIAELQSQLRRYQKIQQELRKQRTKNTTQYSQILQLMGERQQLKVEIGKLLSGEEQTQTLSKLVEEMKAKNRTLEEEIEKIKSRQAASRRKCGQVFLKSLSQAEKGEGQFKVDESNLFDDDAVINLYQSLKENPPNLEKRFKKADRRGTGKVTVEEFTMMMEDLSMLPQDVMSMHRITGFAYGRKALSFEEFKTLLQSRHKNRPLWEKKLIKKLKDIILSSKISLEQFFTILDKDGNGTIEANELRKGLQSYNIFMNHNDWCNLFNLIDSDNSGEIDLEELRNLIEQQKTGNLDNISGVEKVINDDKEKGDEKEEEDEKDEKEEDKEEENEQNKEEEQENKDEEQDKEQKVIPQEQSQKQADDDDKQQKQSYQSRQQIGKDILQQSQQFSQTYTQKTQTLQITGIIKVQLPKVIFTQQQKSELGNEIYAKFMIDDAKRQTEAQGNNYDEEQHVKLIELNKEKQSIAVQFQLTNYKIEDMEKFDMEVSLWKTRSFVEEEYLGEVSISLGKLLEEPNKWAINGKYQLEWVRFEEQEIEKRVVVLQAKWIPGEEEE